MRIVGGFYKGRKLTTPEGTDVRPTTDRMRERIFNILTHSGHINWPPQSICDMFAGTGALGLEALSRGAKHIEFVEQSPTAIRLIKQNLMALEQEALITRADATNLPKTNRSHDLILMDPPYSKGLAMPAIASALAQGYLKPSGIIALEQAKDDPIDFPKGLKILTGRHQGGTRFFLIGSEQITA